MKRSIAITSGKGGVGKTSTAVNLALYFAAEGLRTALLDLDPLADVSSFLDMRGPESALEAEAISPDSPLDTYTIRAFSNLDVLFPGLKLSRGASGRLRSMLTETYRDELVTRYDVLILDLPAGNEEDINLAFADLAETILLVTNPEPTAHMSAGGWCRAYFEGRPGRSVYVWHNKFSAGGPDGFNPRTVVKNYNRNSAPELQISDTQASQVVDLAWVPEDPALSMLESGVPDPQAICLRSMERLCAQIAEQRASTLLENRGMKSALRSFTTEVLGREHALDEEVSELVSEVELLAVDRLGSEIGARVSTLAGIMRKDRSISLLGPEKQKRVGDSIEAVRADRIWSRAATARRRCSMAARTANERGRMFATKASHGFEQQMKIADESVQSLLRSGPDLTSTAVRRNAQVLLFYLAFFKLLRHSSVLGRLRKAIPRRRQGAHVRRDRRQQIRYLVEGDEEYRRRYVAVIRALFPVVTRQIAALAKSMDRNSLIIRRRGKVEKRAYLNLFSNAVHDCLFSGLGIISGFKYREASRAFSEAAEKVRQFNHR